MDTFLEYLETFALPLEDPLINKWIGVEDIGTSDLSSEVQFYSKPQS